MLQISNYNNEILHNISFQLKHNENLIILGSNGAGKSTLAKVLCGITPSSTVSFNHTPLNSINSKERTHRINYVPAKLEIFDEYLSLEEYLDLSRLHTLLESRNMLKLLELEKIKEKPCQQLSSGEQQLTMLASAVLHNAQVTIFDEPTANLDPKKSRDVYALLRSNIFQSKIIITHDLNLAYRLGYKILCINEGKISFFDSSEKFFHPSKLDEHFGSSVQKIDDYIMVNL